jgi:hypothetical protein
MNPTPTAAASVPSNGNRTLWDVQDILLERTSLTGENEVLVVWKPEWIPVSNVQPNGAAMRRFRATPSWPFTSRSCGMRILLPVEPNTTRAVDQSVMQQLAKRSKRSREEPGPPAATHFGGSAAVAPHATGPRQELGSTAKRMPDK